MYLPNAEFPTYFRWDNGLGARTREITFDTMQRQAGHSHTTHQDLNLVV